MAYGGGAVTGNQGGQGFREIVPRCEPGPDFEACRRDLLIEGDWVGSEWDLNASGRPHGGKYQHLG